MSENTLFSGGAIGADTLFGISAKKAGHKCIHYSFEGHKNTPETQDDIVKLNISHLLSADIYVQDANKILRRNFPSKNNEVNNLLRRNYYQIEDSSRIYAICSLDDKGVPVGGTAWALIMGIQRGINQIFVFNGKEWVQFSKLTDKKLFWMPIKNVPKPEGKYTGIGSREINKESQQVIVGLYGQ